MFGPNISGGDAWSPVQRRGILLETPRPGKLEFSRDSWGSHDDVMMTLGFP